MLKKVSYELLREANIDISHPVCTPLPIHLKLSNDDGVLIFNLEA